MLKIHEIKENDFLLGRKVKSWKAYNRLPLKFLLNSIRLIKVEFQLHPRGKLERENGGPPFRDLSKIITERGNFAMIILLTYPWKDDPWCCVRRYPLQIHSATGLYWQYRHNGKKNNPRYIIQTSFFQIKQAPWARSKLLLSKTMILPIFIYSSET